MAARGSGSLTPEQGAAINYPENVLLTACPGSGKTRTLIAKLVREMEGVRNTPRRIACITYTNTAVEEIEQRADEQLAPGDEDFYLASTIHSFCLCEILRPFGWIPGDYARSANVLTPDNPAFEDIVRHAMAQINFFDPSSKDFEAFENLNLNSAGRIIGMASQNEAVLRAAPYYWQRCAELHYIDFATIIYKSYCLLRDNPHIGISLCSKFAWFLIDEFQDTSELQIEILKLLYSTGRSKFFAVGDLAQSIYGFAGARPELVEPFGRYINAKQDFVLTANFRSSQRIVDHAELLIPRNPAMTAQGPNQAVAIAPTLVRRKSSFQAITEDFLPALRDNNIGLGDAIVLAKDWGSLISLTRRLRTFDVPVVGPGARPYRRSRLFASLAEQLCGAVVDPQPDSMRQIQRALYKALLQVTGTSNLQVFSFAGRVIVIRLLERARQLAENGGAIFWLDRMSAATGEILLEAEFLDRTQSGLFFASVQEMKQDMDRQNVDMANLAVDDLGLFASPQHALRLSTIHGAKGREYHAVAMIGLREGSFPYYKTTDMDGERRQFYVAVTRAQKLLMYISEPDKWNNPPSRFLGAGGVRMF